MTTSEWRKRIKKLEGSGHKLLLETLKKCETEHGKCCEKVCDTIAAWYAKYATDGKVTYIEAVRLNRMLELIDCVEDELEETIEEENDYLLLLLASLFGLYSKRLNFNVDLETYKVKWIADGIWLDNDLRNLKTTLLFYIQTTIKQALARGDNLNDILAQIRKRFKSSYKGLESLLQTKLTDYEADIIKDWIVAAGHSKYVWVTIQDGRQCDECDAMDGLIFHVKDYERGVTAPALHRRCRCQIVPLIEPATL